VEDVLATAGKAPQAASFGEHAPSTIGGKVLRKPMSYHAREYDPSGRGMGAPKFTTDGRPVWGISVDVQTAMREGPEDNGVRRMYLEKPRQLAAVREALAPYELPGVEVGGIIEVTWTGTEPGRGSIEANTYSARYITAAQAASMPHGGVPQPVYTTPTVGNIGNGQPPPAWAQPTAQPQIAVQPGAQADPAKVVTATTAAALANAGVDLSGYTIIPG
jgi:hypothetical protein